MKISTLKSDMCKEAKPRIGGSRFWVLEKQDEYEGLCWNFVGWVSGFGQSGRARRLHPKGLKGPY
jgi:hypothetical protein